MKFFTEAIRNLAGNQANFKIVLIAIFILCLADASFIPMPAQTALLIVLMMYPRKAVSLFIASFAGTIAGALAGYLVVSHMVMNTADGLTSLMNFLYTSIPGFSKASFMNIQYQFHLAGPKILFGAAFTPIPYGLFALTAAVLGYSFLEFLIITVIGQGIKFCLLAFIVTRPGQWLKSKLTRHLSPFATIMVTFIVLLIFIS
jgi:membrane protein YqaA with SNARE-associated domain